MDESDPLFLPMVRRLEAVGFRAWPAREVSWDGSWQIRMTPGHPSKRLNSVVPLDRGDVSDLDGRLDRAEARYRAEGIVMSVRRSPLCPPGLVSVLKTKGFAPKDETLVMTADLAGMDLNPAMDHLPTQDSTLFAEACLAIDTARDTSRDVLTGILGGIRPPHGMFLLPDANGHPQATALVVADNDLAGLSQVVVAEGERRKGLGREIVTAALRWARQKGARQAWLQVIGRNRPAIALYETLGFVERYRYEYWRRG